MDSVVFWVIGVLIVYGAYKLGSLRGNDKYYFMGWDDCQNKQSFAEQAAASVTSAQSLTAPVESNSPQKSLPTSTPGISESPTTSSGAQSATESGEQWKVVKSSLMCSSCGSIPELLSVTEVYPTKADPLAQFGGIALHCGKCDKHGEIRLGIEPYKHSWFASKM